MKTFLLLILFVVFGCSEKEIIDEHNVFDLAMSGPVSAGGHRLISKDETLLVGDSSNINPSTTFSWMQLAGAHAQIEAPSSIETKIKNLQSGIYMFSLSRTDGTETLSDTVVITVSM